MRIGTVEDRRLRPDAATGTPTTAAGGLRYPHGGLHLMIDPSTGVAALSGLILLVGAVLGLISRGILRVVGRRSHLSIAGSVLAGIAGSAIAGGVAHLFAGSPEDTSDGLLLLVGVLGTIAVLLVAERFVKPRTPTALELIDAGESATVEFKSTARHNVRSGRRDDRIEAVVAKTLAGFLNTRGGTLLVGVDDAGSILGVDDDLQYIEAADLEGYERWLREFLTGVLGAAAVGRLGITFPLVAGRAICRVDVRKSPRPVVVRPATSDRVLFYARIGNSTRELSVAEAIEYAIDHFHRRRRT